MWNSYVKLHLNPSVLNDFYVNKFWQNGCLIGTNLIVPVSVSYFNNGSVICVTTNEAIKLMSPTVYHGSPWSTPIVVNLQLFSEKLNNLVFINLKLRAAN